MNYYSRPSHQGVPIYWEICFDKILLTYFRKSAAPNSLTSPPVLFFSILRLVKPSLFEHGALGTQILW